MTKTAVYARVSSDSPDQKHALEQQLDRLRTAAPDAQEFIEIESGSRTDRPIWDQLMAACKAGTIDRVISTRLDRISRSRVHGSQILQYFMRGDSPSLELLDDSLDLSTSGGRFMAHLLIGWSASESERLGERTRHGHAHRRAQGKPFGPKAPWGLKYNSDRSNYEIDEKLKLIALDLINKYSSGELGLRGCVKYAHTKHAIDFGGQTSFKRWILNPSLAGMRVYGVSTVHEDESGNKRRVHNRPGVYGEIHPNAHPALISEVEHARIVSMFEAPRDQATFPLREGRVRVATGLAVCSHCHRRLQVHMSGTKRWYRCGNDTCEVRFRNRVREEGIIDAACCRMTTLAGELTTIAAAVDMQDKNPETPEMKILRDKIDALVSTGVAEVKPQIQQFERELRLLRVKAEQRSTLDLDAVQRFFASEEGWRRMLDETPAALRELLLANVAAVLVRDAEVEGVVLSGEL